MKVVVAIDSFKGSLTSMAAGNAAKNGILKTGDHQVVVKPLADGDEGTTEALISGLGGQLIDVEVLGPMRKNVKGKYGILADKNTAVMEMAESSGIILVPSDKLDPWKATTYGLGQMIVDALDRGCRRFIIGIGGSATTEVGIGMLQALGYRFLDEQGEVLSYDFESLSKVERIDFSSVDKRLDECEFEIACDVKNPLYGPNGAIYIFGPQKGVKEIERPLMNDMVMDFAKTVDRVFGTNYDDFEGAGAAGGLGYTFKTFFKNATLRSGIDIVLDAIKLTEELKDADVVVTGEGRLDGQTAMGKVPVGVARLAKKYGCKVVAIAGSVTEDAIKCNREGIDAFFPIVRGITTLEDAMKESNAIYNIESTLEQIFRLLG